MTWFNYASLSFRILSVQYSNMYVVRSRTVPTFLVYFFVPRKTKKSFRVRIIY